jgi:hypothetical protein
MVLSKKGSFCTLNEMEALYLVHILCFEGEYFLTESQYWEQAFKLS